tara:strand:- start:20486 stop:21358 length:873 start_codon:yes stop_codon:yes gene_type:complete
MKPSILVLGSSGLNGNAIFTYLYENLLDFDIYGSYLNNEFFIKQVNRQNIFRFDCLNNENHNFLFEKYKPSIVINCVGITKHLFNNYKHEEIKYINSIFPHRLAELCNIYKARLIHLSTDCVFSGNKGDYKESDMPDATDFYGTSKSEGELKDLNHLTIRTSVVGHEIRSKNGLLEWFLHQDKQCAGYCNAFFSGLTTYELAKIINNFVISNNNLSGIIHLAGNIINKYELLEIFSKVYMKKIKIVRDYDLKINRSLNSEKFEKISGYKKNSWENLIIEMKKRNYVHNHH